MLAVFALSVCSRNSEPAGSESFSEAVSIQAVTPVSDRTTAPAAASVKVTVSLSPAVAKLAGPNDVVFIFARAAQGPRMPLAIVRKQVRDLPTTVILDDSVSMSPQMKLSTVPEVVVVARVSKSVTAGAQAGDLEGMSAPVKPSKQTIDISIAKVVTGNSEAGGGQCMSRAAENVFVTSANAATRLHAPSVIYLLHPWSRAPALL